MTNSTTDIPILDDDAVGAEEMSFARYAKKWSEPHCRNCYHANEANADGSCSAYGYNGVDCQAQPCVCRNHIVMVHPNPLTLQEQEAKQS